MSFSNCPLIAYKGATYGDLLYPSYAFILLNGTTLIGFCDNLDLFNPFLILRSAMMSCMTIIYGIMIRIGEKDMSDGSIFGDVAPIMLWLDNIHMDPSITIHII